MQNVWLFVLGLLLCVSSFNTYSNTVSDSVLVARKEKIRFVFNFDARYTLFDNEQVRISGLKTGLEWHKKLRTGIGYYFMQAPFISRFPAASPDHPLAETRVKLHYGAVYGEYILLQNMKWEVSLPVQVGFGELKNEGRSASGTILYAQTDPLFLAEPSVAGHYKVWSWAGIGAGIGYRQMLGQASQENRQLSAPIYYIKVKLFTGEIYRLLRNKYCMPTL